MAFAHDDVVRVIGSAPLGCRPSNKAWIVGISEEADRSGDYREEFPFGIVYTVEFEDGMSMSIHEANLRKA